MGKDVFMKGLFSSEKERHQLLINAKNEGVGIIIAGKIVVQGDITAISIYSEKSVIAYGNMKVLGTIYTWGEAIIKANRLFAGKIIGSTEVEVYTIEDLAIQVQKTKMKPCNSTPSFFILKSQNTFKIHKPLLKGFSKGINIKEFSSCPELQKLKG